MCNYGSSIVKLPPKKILATYGQSYQDTTI